MIALMHHCLISFSKDKKKFMIMNICSLFINYNELQMHNKKLILYYIP
jgi:hypothetical protein